MNVYRKRWFSEQFKVARFTAAKAVIWCQYWRQCFNVPGASMNQTHRIRPRFNG